MFGPTTLLTRFAEELRRAPGAGDFGLEKGLLTSRIPGTRSRAQRPLSPDAGRGRAAKVLVGPMVSIGRWSDLVVSGSIGPDAGRGATGERV